MPTSQVSAFREAQEGKKLIFRDLEESREFRDIEASNWLTVPQQQLFLEKCWRPQSSDYFLFHVKIQGKNMKKKENPKKIQ